jgi:hypothetical protein
MDAGGPKTVRVPVGVVPVVPDSELELIRDILHIGGSSSSTIRILGIGALPVPRGVGFMDSHMYKSIGTGLTLL